MHGANAAPLTEQIVTVIVQGAQGNERVYIEPADGPPIPLTDPGRGVLSADLHGSPSRFLQLRLVQGDGASRHIVYDGLIVLTDQTHETVGFVFSGGNAVRVPISPSAQVNLAVDPRVSWWMSFGWGALSLGFVALFAGLSIAQRHRARPGPD